MDSFNMDDYIGGSSESPAEMQKRIVEDEHGKIESTGGKSDYYKIHFPEKVAERIAKAGYVEIEDLMKYGFGNDFDYSTALKSLKRMFEDQYGTGKAGSDIQYNKNKICYSLNKIMQDLEEQK